MTLDVTNDPTHGEQSGRRCFPACEARPVAANVNYGRNGLVNPGVCQVGTNGEVSLYNAAGVVAHIAVWFDMGRQAFSATVLRANPAALLGRTRRGQRDGGI